MEDTQDSARSFWSAPCGPGGKVALLALLLLCFAIQTTLVYTDPSPSPHLSEQAAAGRRIWHDNNCQACHQLFGFGGFLGPDLTNSTARLGPERFEQVLTQGSVQMPAFAFSGEEIAAITAYLSVMDETGKGQAFAPAETAGMQRVLASAVANAGDPAASAGWNRFVNSGCLACHFSPLQSTLGAADLLDVCGRLDEAAIMQVLIEGKPPKMPPLALTAEQRTEIHTFLVWLYANRESIRQDSGSEPIRWSQVPWWEFDR